MKQLSTARIDLRRWPAHVIGWWGLMLCLFVWSYWPTLQRVLSSWRSDPDYSHGVLVLPIAWAIWQRRRGLDELPIGPLSVFGLTLVAAAAILRITAARYYLLPLDSWSIPVWLGGVVWCFAGWQVFRRALPALAFLWFAAPLPDRFQQLLSLPLQERAAAGSAWLLQCLGEPAVVSGTTLLLRAEVFEVEHACSGLRMFFGSLAMATAFVLLGSRDRLTNGALLLAVAPIALLANIVRIVATTMIYQRTSEQMARRFVHDFSGLLMVAVAFVGFWSIVVLIRSVRRSFHDNRDQFFRWLPVWPVSLAALLMGLIAWHNRQQELVHRSLLSAASQYEQTSDWQSAVSYLRHYVQFNQNDGPALARLARAMNFAAVELSDRRKALTAMTAAWRANPDDLPLAGEQARLALALQQYAQVVETTEAMLVHPRIQQREHAELRKLAARWRAMAMYDLLAESDDYAPFGWIDVARALEEATQLDASFPQHAFRLAVVYRERLNSPSLVERSQMADKAIDELVQVNSESAEAWLVRYRYRRRFHRYSETTPDELASIDADLDRAVALDETSVPRNVHVLVAAAERMRERGNLDASLSHYQAALEANPQDVRPYLAISEIWIERGTPQARRHAVDVLQQGLAIIGAREVPLIFPLIEQLVVLNELEAAERYTVQAEASIDEFSEPLRTTYRIQLQHVKSWRLAKRSAFGSAAADLAAILDALSPKYTRSAQAYVAQGWANVAQYFRMANDWNRAAEAYQRAAALDDAWRLEYRWSLARRAEMSGDLKFAAQQLRDLAAEGGDSSSAWFEAAAVALRQQILLPEPLRDWTHFHRALDSARTVAADRLDQVLVLEANQLLILGQDERVLAMLTAALEQFPQSVALHRSLALLQARRGNLELALATARKLPPIESDPTESVLLQTEILRTAGRHEEAVRLLTMAASADGPKQLTTLYLELARTHMQRGEWLVAKQWLEEAADNDPNDLRVTEALGQLAWCLQDWNLLEECESSLRLIEGNYGPLWRTFRIRRILAQTSQSQDRQSASEGELDNLTQQLETLYPHMQQTRIAAGRVATYRGLLWKAVANYEEAWELGMPRVSLAVDLISLLNELGETERAQRYVDEIRQYLSATQHVIDGAVIDLVHESADEAIELSEALVKQNPRSDAYLRLGRTLVLTAIPRDTRYADRLQRAELAFRAAVELAPHDTRTWAALFRYLVSVKRDLIESHDLLEKLAAREDISQLNRTFVLAQLNESIANDALADQMYRQAIMLAEQQPNAGERLVVLERAAQFFRRVEPAYAEQCCRAALAIEPAALGPEQILLELLLARHQEASTAEALRLIEATSDKWSSSDQGKRLAARVYLQAARVPGEVATKWQERAIRLLNGAVNKTSYDALLLTELYLLTNQRTAAVGELRIVSESLPADVDSLLRFLGRYDDQLFADTRLRLYTDRIYDLLEELPGHATAALDLRLESVLKRAGKEAGPRRAIAGSTIHRFARRVIEQSADESSSFRLLVNLMQHLVVSQRWEFAQQLAESTPELLPAPRPVAALATALALSDPRLEQVKLLRAQVERWRVNDPGNAELQFAVANLHFMFGEYDQAVALFRAVLERAPSHTMSLNNVALALAMQNKAAIPQALQTLEQAIRIDGRTPQLLDSLAVLYLLSDRSDEASELLLEALSDSNDPTMFLHLAQAWHNQGNQQLARFALSMANSQRIASRALLPLDREMYEGLQESLEDKLTP